MRTLPNPLASNTYTIYSQASFMVGIDGLGNYLTPVEDVSTSTPVDVSTKFRSNSDGDVYWADAWLQFTPSSTTGANNPIGKPRVGSSYDGSEDQAMWKFYITRLRLGKNSGGGAGEREEEEGRRWMER